MSHHFYKAPLDLGGIFRNKKLKTCSLGDSISQYILMLISTRKGELQSDPDFGCNLWDLEFELVVNQRKWEETVANSLALAIKKYEKRLKATKVKVTFSEIEVSLSIRNTPEIKKQANILVIGKLRQTDKNFKFSTNVFVSPFSM